MRRGLIAISLLATSCWTSASAPPAPPASAAGAPAPSGSERALASELADHLRDPDDSMFVEHFIDRQIVVLAMDAATLEVMCEAQTLTAAVRFSDLLNDPDRPPARCTTGATGARFICTQGTGDDYLRLDFVLVDHNWRLLGGILPRGPGSSGADQAALLRGYHARLGVPACPP